MVWCAPCRWLVAAAAAATHVLCLSFTPLQQARGRIGREKERKASSAEERWYSGIIKWCVKMEAVWEKGEGKRCERWDNKTAAAAKKRERRRSEGCREGGGDKCRTCQGRQSLCEHQPILTYFILHQHVERGMRRGWWIIKERERWMRMRLPSSSSLLPPSQPFFSLFFLRPPFLF